MRLEEADRLKSQDQVQEWRTSRRHAAEMEVVQAGVVADLETVVACLLCYRPEAGECETSAEEEAFAHSCGQMDLVDQVDLLACAGLGRNDQEAVHEESHALVEDRSPCQSLAEEGREGQVVGSHSQEQRRECQGNRADRQGLEILAAAEDL